MGARASRALPGGRQGRRANGEIPCWQLRGLADGDYALLEQGMLCLWEPIMQWLMCDVPDRSTSIRQ